MEMSVSQGLMRTNTNPLTKVTECIRNVYMFLKYRNTELHDG